MAEKKQRKAWTKFGMAMEHSIHFRVGSEYIKMLESLRKEGETHNQTARRVLCGLLKGGSNDSK